MENQTHSFLKKGITENAEWSENYQEKERMKRDAEHSRANRL